MLPFLHDKLRFAVLLRLVGARETRRAARLSSSCRAVRVRRKHMQVQYIMDENIYLVNIYVYM